ncbi:MAG: hypothetical protein V4537_14285 [Pseudomonadota bacterium]
MKVLVEVRLFDPTRGESIDVTDEVDEQYADNQHYMWTEGNMGCDCNKRLCIERKLRGPGSYDSGPCGTSIKLERLAVAGEVVLWQPRQPCVN